MVFSELEVAPFGAFSCPKLRLWNYFFQIAWNTKKLFDSKLLCSELEVVPFCFILFKTEILELLFFRLLGTQESFSIQSCFALSWK